jgi:hypothetical protein
VRRFCQEPDRTNIDRRFPAWREVDSRGLGASARRIEQIVRVIEEAEEEEASSRLGPESDAVGLEAGTLVFNPRLGVTVLAKVSRERDFRLLDLSLSDDRAPKYASLVYPALLDDRKATCLRWFGASESRDED